MGHALPRDRRTSWEHVIPFLALPDELRAVYTTNTIEGRHRQIRKAIKTAAIPRRTSRHQAYLPRNHAPRRHVAAQPHLDRAPRREKIHFETNSPASTHHVAITDTNQKAA